MRLATVRGGNGLHAAVLARTDGTQAWVAIADVARAVLGDAKCPDSLAALLVRDGCGLATARLALEAVEKDDPPNEVRRWPFAEANLAPPIPAPGAFLDFYAFEGHVRAARARRGLEMEPAWYANPSYYRSNHRSFLGHREEVWFPGAEAKMDFELELGAVLGTGVESPTPAQAETAIAGYCLLNVWSARAIQREVMKVGLGPNKGKDFATSLGPWLVTPDEVGDLARVELTARVNGKEWSRGTPGDMHWSWGELIAFAGEGVRFEPGDIFGSGTVPGGCGLEQDRFLEEGDVVELDGGERLGVLAGTVRRRPAGAGGSK